MKIPTAAQNINSDQNLTKPVQKTPPYTAPVLPPNLPNHRQQAHLLTAPRQNQLKQVWFSTTTTTKKKKNFRPLYKPVDTSAV